MKILHLKGKVFAGSGEGAKFIELPWVRTQIAKKLGFIPYPGTLNIRLTKDTASSKKLLREVTRIEISPVEGFCLGRCAKAFLINGLECAVIFPEVKNYPEDIVEVVAPIDLRENFRLKDGDMVEIKIVL